MNSRQHFFRYIKDNETNPMFFMWMGYNFHDFEKRFKNPSGKYLCKTTIRHMAKHVLRFESSQGRISFQEAKDKIGNPDDNLSWVKSNIPFGLTFTDADRLENIKVYTVSLSKLFTESERFKQYLQVRNKLYENLKDLEEQNSAYRKRVFDRRSFPPKLKYLIFERDNFTCQICLRSKEKLIEADLHLEADHIIEWEDGGKTCYKNGQAVCSACNKAKHAAKKARI